MIEKTCDTCKKKVDKLNKLVDDYQSNYTSEVCDKCLSEINNVFFNINKAQNIQRDNFIRRFIKSMIKN